jgi:hypothetical protein
MPQRTEPTTLSALLASIVESRQRDVSRERLCGHDPDPWQTRHEAISGVLVSLLGPRLSGVAHPIS